MSVWPSRIGSAWPRADGNGFNIQLETVPLDGRVAYASPQKKINNQLGRASQPAHFLFPRARLHSFQPSLILPNTSLAVFKSTPGLVLIETATSNCTSQPASD